MKFTSTIIISVIAAIISAVLIFFRHSFGDSELIKKIAYFAIPAILYLVITLKYFKYKLFANLTIGMLSYGILFSLLEPMAYKFWVKMQTPAGDFYTRYELDGLYPIAGFIILLAMFIIVMVLAILWEFIKKILHSLRKKVRSYY